MSMTPVVARVKCSSKSPVSDGAQGIGFTPDYDDVANEDWSRYTDNPTLQLGLSVTEEVGGRFEIGKTYTLLLTDEEPPTGKKVVK